MAWTTPVTAVTNATLSAAQWNASVRDNLNETAPAKATVGGRLIVTDGLNAIVERQFLGDLVETSQTTTSTTYTNLTTAGPLVEVTASTQVMTWHNAAQANSTTGAECWSSIEFYGATTSAAIDARAMLTQATANYEIRAGVCTLNAVSSGLTTVRMQYRVSAGTGTFRRRRMTVLAL